MNRAIWCCLLYLAVLVSNGKHLQTNTVQNEFLGTVGLSDGDVPIRLDICPVPTALNPRPAGVFGRTRPAGGGGEGRFCPLSNSRTDGRRKTKNGKRKLSTKRIFRTPKILLKEIRAQVRVRSKVKTTGFHIIGFRAQLASSWARHPKRVQRLVKRRAVLKTL